MKTRIKKICASLLAAVMVFTYMPVFGLGAVYGAEYTGYSVRVTSPTTIPDQPYTGNLPDLSDVDELATITATVNGSTGVVLTRGTDYSATSSTSAAGPATVVFEGMGDYEGAIFSGNVSFNISEDPSTVVYTATIDTTGFVYGCGALTANEGSVVKNAVKVLKNGKSKAAASEYSVKVTAVDATKVAGNAGEQYKVEISTTAATPVKFHEETVEIAKKPLADLTLTANYTKPVYDGTEQKPAITVTATGYTLSTTDYTITDYSNNINATTSISKATATVTATATSNFSGSSDVQFEIDPYKLSSSTLVIVGSTSNSFEFNGQAPSIDLQEKVYTADAQAAKLIDPANYEVVADTDVTAGEHNATIKGKAPNVTGEYEVKNAYTITTADLKNAKEELKTGVAGVPAGTAFDTPEDVLNYFNVKVNGYSLTKDDFTASGVATVRANEKGTITLTAAAGSKKVKETYTISYTSIEAPLAEKYTSAFETSYDGTEKKPLSNDLGTLKRATTTGAVTLAPTEYEVTGYKDNVNAGTATAYIKGLGKYKDETSEATFTIVKKSLNGYEVSEVTGLKDGKYYKSAEIEGLSVKLVKKSGTTVVDTVQLPEGEFTVTVDKLQGDEGASQKLLTGLTVTLSSTSANYTATSPFQFTVTERIVASSVDLYDAEVTGTIPAGLDWTTTGNPANIIQKYAVVKVDNTIVTKDAYTVSDITCATTGKTLGQLNSTVSFKITANATTITGSKTATLEVAERDLTDAVTIAFAGGELTYNGDDQEPAVTVTLKDTEYVKNAALTPADYDVTYSNNVNAGTETAVATVTGKGNFKNSESENFSIGKANLGSVAVGDFPSVQFALGAPEDKSDAISLKKKDSATKYVIDASDFSVAMVAEKPVVVGASKTTTKDAVEATDSYDATWVRYNVTVNENSKNYTAGSFTVDCPFIKKQVKDATVTLENTTVTVTVDGTTLVQDKDYTLGVDVPVNEAGQKAKVTVAFKGNYAGNASAEFTIVNKDTAKYDIDNVTLTAPTGSEAMYTGNPIQPTVYYIGDHDGTGDWYTKATNKYDNKYYKVVYRDSEGKVLDSAPVAVGKYTATVEATVEYGGKSYAEEPFEITKRVLSKNEFTDMVGGLSVGTVSYYGTATEVPTVTGANADEFEVTEFVPEWDADNGTAGSLKVGLKAESNYVYAGEGTVGFTWEKGVIDSTTDFTQFFEISDQEYTGAAIEPDIQQVEGADLSVAYVTITSYENNVKASKKSAKAFFTIKVPATDKKYTSNGASVSGSVTFAIVTPEQVVEEADKAEEAAAAIDANYPADSKKAVDEAVADLERAVKSGDTDKIIAATKALNDAVEAAKTAKVDTEKAAADAIVKASAYTSDTYTKASADAVAKASADLEAAVATGDCNKIAAATAALNAAMSKAVAKKANTMKASGKTIKHTASKTKTYKKSKAFTVKSAKGKVTFKQVTKNSKIKVKSNGKVVVKKGLKSGKTYKIKVKVTAKGNDKYLKSTKTVTLKVKVK